MVSAHGLVKHKDALKAQYEAGIAIVRDSVGWLMKIYLDDERTPPTGWTLVRWPKDVIKYIKEGNVTDISLDHDLGDDEIGTGYDVLLWIEKEVYENDLIPPKLSVHSANVSARVKMEAAIQAIERQFKTEG